MASELDNWEVYISGSWGKLTVGDPDDALQMVAGLGDIGFDGLGVDDRAEVGRGLGGSDGVLYSNTIGPASVYASMNKDTSNDDMAVGVKFDAGPVTIGLGYEDTSPYWRSRRSTAMYWSTASLQLTCPVLSAHWLRRILHRPRPWLALRHNRVLRRRHGNHPIWLR